jgi:hypothetical protein
VSAPEPLPCPVAACGRTPRVSERVLNGDGWLVECYSIGSRDEHAVGVRRATRPAAIRAWNRYVGRAR